MPILDSTNRLRNFFHVARLYSSRKRILVTGGAGFLGSHLIDRLLGMTLEVLCVDNLFADAKRNMRNHKRLKFMRHNLTSALC